MGDARLNPVADPAPDVVSFDLDLVVWPAIEMPVGYLYRIRDGLISHQIMFTGTDEARAAFRQAIDATGPEG